MEANASDDRGYRDGRDTYIGEDETGSKTPAKLDELRSACIRGDIGRVKSLLKDRVDITAAPGGGKRTALHFASDSGRDEVVEVLLAHVVVQKGEINESKNPPLALNLTATEEMTLFEDQKFIDAVDVWGRTALHLAANNGHRGVVERLLATGSDVSIQAVDGCTPLMDATKQGHVDVMRTLLRTGDSSQVSITNKEGDTPLDVAMREELLDTVTILSNHLRENGLLETSKYDHILSWASQKFNRHGIAKALLAYKAADVQPSATSSAIELAALLARPEILAWLLTTSPNYHETKRAVKKAIKLLISRGRWVGRQPGTAEVRPSEVENQDGDNMNANKDKTCQKILSAQNRVDLRMVADILQDPPYINVYPDLSSSEMPKHSGNAKKYDAYIFGFYRMESKGCRIRRIRTVEEAVYEDGPAAILEEAVDQERKYMEPLMQDLPKGLEIFDSANCDFTWVHLTATNVSVSRSVSINKY